MGYKDEKVLGLFLATVLTFTPGCMMNNAGHTHVDADKDGYCDVDGAPMSNSSTSSSPRYFSNFGTYGNSPKSSPDSSTGHISSASSPKGGIGSHSIGSGG